MSNKTPMISVIIPIFNTKKYLEQCIESVIKQKYRYLEIFLIDDGSSEDVASVCDGFVAQDKRVKFIQLDHRGKSFACNYALKYCRGEYISIIDSDDWLELNMYEKLIQKMNGDEKVDISVCNFYKEYSNAAVIVKNKKKVPIKVTAMREFLKYIYERDIYPGVASYLWNRLIKRSIIVDNDILFENDVNIGEDVLFTAYCYLYASKITYTSECLYHYRQRDDSLMHSPMERLKKLSSCHVYKKIIDIYAYAGIDKNIIDYIKRFYVYHPAILLELIYKNQLELKQKKEIILLRQYINEYIDIYIKLNKKNKMYIDWLNRVLSLGGNSNV